MLYLEDLLKTMDSKADVIVRLSSHTTYEVWGDKITKQDTCGNHHTRNWLEAIKVNHLEKTFEVKDVSVEFEYYMEQPQWTVLLVNKKSAKTDILDRESNSIGCSRVIAHLYRES